MTEPSVESPSGIREAVRTCNPGLLRLVMAAGIVSVAMYHHRAYALAVAMVCLTGVDFVVLL